MKKYKLKKEWKERLILTGWFLITISAMLIATKIYTERVEKISNGEMIVQCRCGE